MNAREPLSLQRSIAFRCLKLLFATFRKFVLEQNRLKLIRVEHREIEETDANGETRDHQRHNHGRVSMGHFTVDKEQKDQVNRHLRQVLQEECPRAHELSKAYSNPTEVLKIVDAQGIQQSR